jgi:6-phosphogluconolactonase
VHGEPFDRRFTISQRSHRVLVFDPPAFAAGAATEIAQAVQGEIQRLGRCELALAGGSTPRPVYDALSRPPFGASIDWGAIGIYFGDERCVLPDDERSNYRMGREALLNRVAIPATSVHRMTGEHPDPDEAAREYERVLPRRLGVLLLGMGDDGHTASIFPNSPALAERERRVIAVRGPAAGPMRLTITPPVIQAAGQVIVLIAGIGKATAVARALEGPYTPDEFPVQLALGGTWILDTDAARVLPGT